MGILLCEQNFRDVWRRNKSVSAEIGKILRTHTHTHAAQLVVRICMSNVVQHCVRYTQHCFDGVKHVDLRVER